MTPDIENLQFSAESKPFVHHCASRFDTVEKLDQQYLFIPSLVRDAYLAYLLRNDFTTDGNTENSIIIFTSRARTGERLRIMLKELGVATTALHSKMSQTDRLGSIAKFKSGIIRVLIATDVGSRGLDIPAVKVVINYDLPLDPTDYIHRAGRTARAGRGGLCLSMVTERDIDVLLNIEKKIGKKFEEYPIDSEKEVLASLNEVGLARRVANMHLVDTNFAAREKRPIDSGKKNPPSSSAPAKKKRKTKKEE
ncbi:hypothetical protein HK102_001908 [Quaeritorhiza haematococci]|nr:hypothetical protein HK102_001908 [Quaeritorhiza haematococci]